MARSTGRQARGARSRVGTAPALPVSCAQPPSAYQALHNYAADAGRGSDTFSSSDFSSSDTWRAALLGTVAAGALFFGYGRSARAACAGPSPTLTCTGIIAGNAVPGVVNGGINVPAGYTTLNVNSITADITPNSGVDGIFVYTTSDITINSNTGPYSILTTGGGADGIYAHSDDGDVTVDSTGDVRSDNNRGIFARNYSAGAVSVTSVGGVNGIRAQNIGIFAQSDFGDVTVDSTGDVRSYGNRGISARSFVAGDVSVTSVGGVNGIRAQNIGIYAYSDDGDVTVASTGDVRSYGNRGISARSSGAGDVEVTSVGGVNGIRAQNIGIFAQSTGGDVTVASTGDVRSYGNRGISARSFGAGDVSVTSVGGPNGIRAQSYGIYALSDFGAITVDSTGDVMSDGNDAIQTQFGASSTVTLHSGTVHGADDGVEFRGGTTNTLTNYATLSGGALAVRGSYGNETVDNFGTITGSVDLGDGDNAFNNQAGATFNAGATVDLDPANTLTNDGTLAPEPFGIGTIGTTSFTGNLVQGSGGVFAVDVDMASNDADAIDMNSSGTASMDGGVALNFFNLSPLPQAFTILSAATDIPVQSLVLLNPAVLAAITYPGDTDVLLTITGYDFSAPGLNANQTSIGDNLNGIFGAGGGGLGDVLTALANLTSLPGFANALDQLSPEIYGDTQLAALYASLDFSGNLLSCKMNGADTAAINREGQCLWAGAKARFLDSEQTFDNIGFDETAGLFAAGAQLALDPVWRLGFGLGYQTSTLDTDTGATSDGDMVQGGVALKYNPGALLLAGVVSGGRGWYDTTRPMAFSTFAATAEGEHEIDILSGRLHASYVLGAPSLYFKPMVDAAVTRLDLGDVTETGAGAASLVVNGEETTVFSVSPALELGTEWWLSNGTLVRPFVRAGVTWFSDDDVPVSAAFAGAPAGVGPFTIRSEIDEVQADVAAGLEMVNSEDSAMRLSYDGHFGEDIEIHSVGFKASARF